MDFPVCRPNPLAMYFLPCGFSESLCGSGEALIFFFFCQKVQQQLILTCCYGLSMHSFIFQNIVCDKIKLMPIFFLSRDKKMFKLKESSRVKCILLL